MVASLVIGDVTYECSEEGGPCLYQEGRANIKLYDPRVIAPGSKAMAVVDREGRPLVTLIVDPTASHDVLMGALKELARTPGGEEDATVSAALGMVSAALAARASTAIAAGRT